MSKLTEYSATLSGGLRGNQYQVLLNLPAGVAGDTRTFSFMVRATNVPGMETGIIEKNYKGRNVKFAGDSRPNGVWTPTVDLNDGASAATAKKIADQWEALARESLDPADYKSTAKIQLLSKQSQEIVLEYELEGVWIANSGELDLGEENIDTIIEFPIEFQYDLSTQIA